MHMWSASVAAVECRQWHARDVAREFHSYLQAQPGLVGAAICSEWIREIYPSSARGCALIGRDADEAVSRAANTNIQHADDTQRSVPCTLAEYHYLARKNSLKLYSPTRAANTAADAVLKCIKSSRKTPSREALAEAIKMELLEQEKSGP
jgi:hypothetical protein